jgi:hypothetical protein
MLLPHLETAVLVLILPFFSSASTSPRPLHQIRTRQLPLSTPITQNATFQPIFKMGFFDQLVEHSNPKIGNFVQRYIYHENYWKGPGSPIILVAGGEFSISYSSNGTNAHDHGIIEDHTAVVLAKRIGAAVLAIEHRYFGTSVPFMNLTDMRYNSVENSIADLINFARTVRLPFDPTGNSHAPQVPWVLVGCSAAGAISAWLERREPGTFWAYHLFSATVQVEPAWSYTIPILDNIPKNCSRDASMVWEYMDDIAVHGTKQDRLKLQADFGLAKIETYEEFATSVSHPSDVPLVK